MKPIYLKMTAFGSYCGTSEVDFTRFYDSGLFLITGKTGGGKTTILDAICVALYGKATGSERAKDWKQLRCGSAPSSVDTELEYIFSLGGMRYRFYRRWHLPNSKKEEPQLKDVERACYRCPEGADEWELITSRSAKDVNEAAEDILKLTQAQFVKVIMLPQGEFRELLTASSDEKEAIFKKLFDTERWERLTERISEEFRKIDRQCGQHTADKAAALKGAGCETVEELQDKIRQQQSELERLRTLQQENAVKAAQCQEVLTEAEKISADFEELAQQRAAWQTLHDDAPRFDALEHTLQQSRRWRGALPAFQMRNAARAHKDNCAQALAAAKAQKESAAATLMLAAKDAAQIPSLEASRDQLQAEGSILGELAKNHAAYNEHLQKIRDAKASLAKANATKEQLLAKGQQLSDNLTKGKGFLEDYQAAARALPEATDACHQIRQQWEWASEYETAQKELAAIEQQMQASQSALDALTQQLDDRRRIEAIVKQAIMCDKAYSLAVDLSEGTPCPVCGSTHHPLPARPSDSSHTSREWEKCQADVEACDQQCKEASQRHAALVTRRELLQNAARKWLDKAGGRFDQSAAALLAEFHAAQERMKALQSQSEKIPKAQKRLDDLQKELTANTHDIESTNTLINHQQTRLAVAQQVVDSLTAQLQAKGFTDFDRLEQALSRARQDFRALNEQVKRLHDAHSAASAQDSAAQASLQAAQNQWETADAELSDKQQLLRLKCAELGIDEDTDIAAGVLPDEAEAASEQRLADYRRQLGVVQSRIETLSAKLEGKQPPALQALREAKAGADAEGKALAEQAGNAASRLTMLESTAKAVAQAESALATLGAQYETVSRMHGFLSGDTGVRVPIHQYVIGIKMDEVIRSANLYLTRLTKGQYTMKLKDLSEAKRSGRAKHQSLDIEIVDSSAGIYRAVATLSGGELFLTSLSLAFGLSDVVQSFAGGIHLDSLFIDEGFGSLDSETLDTAMDAITQVRENKLLGIISHVSELKERVPYGIEVIKTADGSSLKHRF